MVQLVKMDARYVDFEKGAFELFHYLRGNVGGIDAVETIHTHPSMEVRVIDGEIRRIRSNEISPEDLHATVEFAKRIPAGIKSDYSRCNTKWLWI